MMASSGAEALEIARKQDLDLILMDVKMPGLSGLEATRARRKNPGRNQGLAIIGISGHATAADRTRAIEAGMNAFLEKPVDFERLLAMVARLVKRSEDGCDHPAARLQRLGT